MAPEKQYKLSTSVSVSSKEITATPVADAAQALQGRVSGVTTVQKRCLAVPAVPGIGSGVFPH